MGNSTWLALFFKCMWECFKNSSVWVRRRWFIAKTQASVNSVQSVLGEKETAGGRAFWILLSQDTVLKAESQKRWLGGGTKWNRS